MRKIFSACYSVTDIGLDFRSEQTKISTVSSGRLSFVFVAKYQDTEVFLKIVKPGYVHSNIAFSVLCTEQCRRQGLIPTFKTYAGSNGLLYQQVPAVITDVAPTRLNIFSQQYMTLTQAAAHGIDEIPEQLKKIPGGRAGQLALMETLGEYTVELSRNIQPLIDQLLKNPLRLQEIDTADPAGFNHAEDVVASVFQLDDFNVDEIAEGFAERLARHIEKLTQNLSDDVKAQAFKKGLLRGDLLFVIKRFAQIKHAIVQNLKHYPAKNVAINNEVKPANVGAVFDERAQRWRITQSFDFDNAAWGNELNGDATPLEKDLGRTISFFAFDASSAEFYVENAFAVCRGFLRALARDLHEAEIKRLIQYIQWGVVTSYLWRSSYFADELHGKHSDIELDRLNPSIHVEQLKAFDQWLLDHDFKAELDRNLNT